MSGSQRALLVIVFAALCAAPAAAQIVGHPFEFSGGAGYFHYDARARMTDGPAYTGSLGWRAMPWLSLEGQATFGPTRSDTVSYDLADDLSLGNLDRSFTYAGLDARWNLRPAGGHVTPFLLTGVGYGRSDATGASPEKLERGAGNVGLGVLWTLGASQRTHLRLQVRDHFFRERGSMEFSNHVTATLSIAYLWRGKERDQDLDGVRDWLDKCLGTPIGARVDKNGCPLDGDVDGVFDGLDKCPDTPKGCKVDKTGCSIDSDGDGVCDGVDQCADTPKGATVDAKGCPSDADGDGVLDGIDQCADTPKGCTVDAKGCPSDADGDGVCDGVDQCADTPAGLKVDGKGCPIEVIERETELMDTGKIRLQNVNFETGKAELKPESFPTLDAVGTVLSQWPQLKIEIAGHTDDVGGAAVNRRLSQARAAAVLSYLNVKYPLIDGSRFTVKGYGKDQPLVPNASDEARAMNRRVEFTVLNKEVLKKEIERRRMLKEGEATPADSTVTP
jgi:outer membrane protein OmpA-like peptidoglycan-associated protein